ncbi:MAG: hypothetical protein H7321_00570 [Bacteroidia bacterium]|nr:hypothetical protein [Bacteroidia bacterium]
MKKFSAIVFLLFISCFAMAQYEDENNYMETEVSDSLQEKYNTEKPNSQKLDREAWNKLSKPLDYTEEKEKQKEKKKDDTQIKRDINVSFTPGPVFKVICIALACIILGYILFKIISASLANSKVNSNGMPSSLFEEIDEETLRNLDLNGLLKKALELNDYKSAYRIRYLMVIRLLSSKNLINYRKEKTNFEYLMQLTGKVEYETFRQLTVSFDGIWYGEKPIGKSDYERLSPLFDSLNTQLSQR